MQLSVLFDSKKCNLYINIQVYLALNVRLNTNISIIRISSKFWDITNFLYPPNFFGIYFTLKSIVPFNLYTLKFFPQFYSETVDFFSDIPKPIKNIHPERSLQFQRLPNLTPSTSKTNHIQWSLLTIPWDISKSQGPDVSISNKYLCRLRLPSRPE